MNDSNEALINSKNEHSELYRILFSGVPLSFQNYQKARNIMLSRENQGEYNSALRLIVRRYGEYAIQKENPFLEEILRSLNDLTEELNEVSNDLHGVTGSIAPIMKYVCF